MITAMILAAAAAWLWVGEPRLRLNRLRARRSARFGQIFRRLGPKPDSQSLIIRASCGVGAGIVVMIIFGVQLLGLIVAGVIAIGITLSLGWLEPASVRRKHQQIAYDLPQAIDLLAIALTAGLPLRSAAKVVTDVLDDPLAEQFAAVSRRISIGQPEAQAWRLLAEGCASPALDALGRDLARSVDSGTAIAETLIRHADDARRERAGQLLAQAKAVGVHSVLPTMVCFLPAFLCIGVVPVIAGMITLFLH